jgi:hypothetical protein
MIYVKKPDGTIEQFEDDMMRYLNIDKEIQGESYGTMYTEDSLPDEDKLSLGLITQKEIDDKAKARRIAEIKSELLNIDSQTIRPLRAKMAGTETQADIDKLSELELQAIALREEKKALD